MGRMMATASQTGSILLLSDVVSLFAEVGAIFTVKRVKTTEYK